MVQEVMNDTKDAAWELEKVAVIDWTATGDGRPSLSNYGFPGCIRGSEMMDATTTTIIGKNSDNIPIGFNGIELTVWDKKNPDGREGGTIELVSSCGMDERHGELFICVTKHHKNN
ncbi:uncharacterized protein EAE97_003276 [Botrytis byssoidea]|uniref:Uncharacterized protein n=1 Tax=Botrytis byssoidea TaxID=139641 RepID=A0A9P5IV58_9HELO|nr:uncharacterized protein EAE97_003276 [Botrytis byssoidea]KAF7949767.1 hypothetical protein EAE97_003276 [Botrytis byssoidea]